MARPRRRKGTSKDSREEEVEEMESPPERPSSQPSGSGGTSSSLPLVSELSFASDPDTVAIYDNEALEEFSIFCPMGGIGGARRIAWDGTGSINQPIVFDKVINGAGLYFPRQLTIVNETQIREVIANGLNRIVATPGNLTATEIGTATQEYVARVTNLIHMYCSVAALWGLAEIYPNAKGQLKDYLYYVGGRTQQVDSMASQLRQIPIPSKLYQFLMSWNAVKQIPDGRSIFAVPQQPLGLTPDEIVGGGVGIQYGNLKVVFDREVRELKALTVGGKLFYPELRRILSEAGWSKFEFPLTITPIRNGEWWDAQVINAPYAAKKFSDSVDQQQANPQSGRGNRNRSLSVYGQSNNPYLNRCLLPQYASGSSGIYDRGVGSFDLAGSVTQLDWGLVSMGSYAISGFYETGAIPFNPGYGTPTGLQWTAQAVPLIIGQSQDTTEVGWANTIAGFSASIDVSCLYSEMDNIIQTDASADSANPIGLYELVFKGASTTPSSNRFKFGNTVSPNMYPFDVVDFLQGPLTPTMLTTNGNAGSTLRVYEALLTP